MSEQAVVTWGVDPLKVGDYTPYELTLIAKQKRNAAYVYGDMSMKSVEVPVDGLKVGDTIRATAMSLKVNMDYTSESYFFNTGNILYGWVFDGSGWYQLQDEYDYGYMGEKELSSESPFVSECGLFDYETPNKLTIKISCKRNGYTVYFFT